MFGTSSSYFRKIVLELFCLHKLFLLCDLVHLHDYCMVTLPPQQQVIEDLTKERTEMQERLKDSEQKLNEVEETAQKFLHLQVFNPLQNNGIYHKVMYN